MTHGTQDAPTPSAAHWWNRRRVIAAVVIGVLITTVGVWSARADSPDAVDVPAPSASPTGDGGTRRFTIELTPGWTSQPDPAAQGVAGLSTSAADRDPVVLSGPAPTDGSYRRLDPLSGNWDWAADVAPLDSVSWAGPTSVFSTRAEPGQAAHSVSVGEAPTAEAFDEDGATAFTSSAGRVVAADSRLVVLQNGSTLTALTQTGKRVWRTRLSQPITTPAGRSGLSTPLLFTSKFVSDRASLVDLRTGEANAVRFKGPANATPWVTPAGIVVPGESALNLYGSSGDRRWSAPGSFIIEDVDDDVLLISDRAPGPESMLSELRLLRLSDGATIWTSEPIEPLGSAASLMLTDSGQVLVAVERAPDSEDGPAVLAVDPATGEQVWEVGDRWLLGVWRGYVLLGESDNAVISALGAPDGTSFATLNVASAVTPESSAIVGNSVIYVNHGEGTAHSVTMSDTP